MERSVTSREGLIHWVSCLDFAGYRSTCEATRAQSTSRWCCVNGTCVPDARRSTLNRVRRRRTRAPSRSKAGCAMKSRIVNCLQPPEAKVVQPPPAAHRAGASDPGSVRGPVSRRSVNDRRKGDRGRHSGLPPLRGLGTALRPPECRTTRKLS